MKNNRAISLLSAILLTAAGFAGAVYAASSSYEISDVSVGTDSVTAALTAEEACSLVYISGSIVCSSPELVDRTADAVRPALWIQLEP